MRALTDRQKQVLSAIHSAISESGYPPTIREIGDALGIKSTNGVNDHLKALERKGYIERGDAKSRAISLTNRAIDEFGEPYGDDSDAVNDDSVRIPVLGRIAAGLPIEAVENADETVSIDRALLGRSDGQSVFGLRVEGESMINDGIYDGDLVFVKQQETASRGEIVAVVVDGQATVKRIYPESGRIRLQPANDHMEPIYIAPETTEDVRIVGKVVGVFREVH